MFLSLCMDRYDRFVHFLTLCFLAHAHISPEGPRCAVWMKCICATASNQQIYQFIEKKQRIMWTSTGEFLSSRCPLFSFSSSSFSHFLPTDAIETKKMPPSPIILSNKLWAHNGFFPKILCNLYHIQSLEYSCWIIYCIVDGFAIDIDRMAAREPLMFIKTEKHIMIGLHRLLGFLSFFLSATICRGQFSGIWNIGSNKCECRAKQHIMYMENYICFGVFFRYFVYGVLKAELMMAC